MRRKRLPVASDPEVLRRVAERDQQDGRPATRELRLDLRETCLRARSRERPNHSHIGEAFAQPTSRLAGDTRPRAQQEQPAAIVPGAQPRQPFNEVNTCHPLANRDAKQAPSQPDPDAIGRRQRSSPQHRRERGITPGCDHEFRVDGDNVVEVVIFD